MQINAEWHQANSMPRNATLDQRVQRHSDHASACGCRSIPTKLFQEMDKRGLLRLPVTTKDPVDTKTDPKNRVVAPSNDEIGHVLERIAELPEAQEANQFRVQAYRTAAASLRGSSQPVAGLASIGGATAISDIPGIGPRIGALVAEYAITKRSSLLERLLGAVAPEDLFTRIPGLGDRLAFQIATELGVETLEELELAAHDGRLKALKGFGGRRVQVSGTVSPGRLGGGPG